MVGGWQFTQEVEVGRATTGVDAMEMAVLRRAGRQMDLCDKRHAESAHGIEAVQQVRRPWRLACF